MARKEFPKEVVESILIKSRRHCAVCDSWCAQNIEIHHIDSPEDNSEDNAIPVCFDCHANIGHYNAKHPKGKKYTPSELRKLRDICFGKYSDTPPAMPEGKSDYGRGFHDGVIWAEKTMALKDIWRLLSVHGDFALEILIYFETDDTHTMMDETFMDENVKLPHGASQYERHLAAWSAGAISGLWGLDGNNEDLFITENGKLFKNLVKTNSILNHRFEELKEFWNKAPYWKPVIKKPSKYWGSHIEDFSPGVLNWLQIEIYKLIRLDNDRSRLFVIHRVTPAELELRDIENGDLLILENDIIRDAEFDQRSGELVLFLNPKT